MLLNSYTLVLVRWEGLVYIEKDSKAKTKMWSLISDLSQEFQWTMFEFSLQPQAELEQIHKKKCQSGAKYLKVRKIPGETVPMANNHDHYRDDWFLK